MGSLSLSIQSACSGPMTMRLSWISICSFLKTRLSTHSGSAWARRNGLSTNLRFKPRIHQAPDTPRENQMLELFPKSEVVGVFRGFREGGLEFHADLTLPYRPKLHNIPMHGQFLLVQLEHSSEAVLGRICSLSAEGRLTSSSGEQYSIRAVSEGRSVPDHLRE